LPRWRCVRIPPELGLRQGSEMRTTKVQIGRITLPWFAKLYMILRCNQNPPTSNTMLKKEKRHSLILYWRLRSSFMTKLLRSQCFYAPKMFTSYRHGDLESLRVYLRLIPSHRTYRALIGLVRLAFRSSWVRGSRLGSVNMYALVLHHIRIRNVSSSSSLAFFNMYTLRNQYMLECLWSKMKFAKFALQSLASTTPEISERGYTD
jgi:hypothetical protein